MKIEKQNLLILDDFGIQLLDSASRATCWTLLWDWYGKRTTIITFQLPVKQLYDVIGEKTVADAI